MKNKRFPIEKGLLPGYIGIIMVILMVFPAYTQKIYSSEEAEALFFPIHDDFKTQIRNALPEKSAVIPIQKRKLLVFNLHVSKDRKPLRGHYSIPYANYAIFQMGEKLDSYDTFFSNDTLIFQPDVLGQFDAVCFQNTGGVLFDDTDLRMNLLDYVYGGGGFIGIHAAAATFVQWPVYDQFPAFGIMLGGYENGGHPWKDNEWITIEVEDPDHPVNQTLGYEKFEISDEVFQFSEPYSRELVRVLMTIDITKTDTSMSRRILPERRADGDLAMSWVKNFGRGRVYYSSFGDNPHINWDTRILNHYLAGIQFALGDLEAPATPSHYLTPAVKAIENTGWTFGLSTYSFRDNTLMEAIDRAASLGIRNLEAFFDQDVSKDIHDKFDFRLEDKILYKIREKLIEKGIHMTNYYIHDFPSDEAACRQLFDFGKKMGIVTFVSEPDPQDLDLIEKYCKEYDIRLAIHNHGVDLSPDYWQPEKVLEAVEGRSDYVGACGDMGYWIRSGIDPVKAIELLDDRLFVLHMHDLHEMNENGHDVPWGEGKADLAGTLGLLKSIDHEGLFISLEYAHNFGKSLPQIEKSIEYFHGLMIRMEED